MSKTRKTFLAKAFQEGFFFSLIMKKKFFFIYNEFISFWILEWLALGEDRNLLMRWYKEVMFVFTTWKFTYRLHWEKNLSRWFCPLPRHTGQQFQIERIPLRWMHVQRENDFLGQGVPKITIKRNNHNKKIFGSIHLKNFVNKRLNVCLEVFLFSGVSFQVPFFPYFSLCFVFLRLDSMILLAVFTRLFNNFFFPYSSSQWIFFLSFYKWSVWFSIVKVFIFLCSYRFFLICRVVQGVWRRCLWHILDYFFIIFSFSPWGGFYYRLTFVRFTLLITLIRDAD